ncbi:MAG: DedA family protein [Pseudomonadales bacterium]|jgi:membrane protein DedA with SNARE-associated domain
MDDLIQRYGYLAILLGAVLEGETVVLLGGFAAHQGHLNVLATIAAAFIGTLIADQFFFYLGRLKGQDYLTRRPAWQAKIGRVFRFIDSHQNLLMLGYRFMYGFRSLTPFALGLANIPRLRFLLFNLASALFWSIAVVMAGYLSGSLLNRWLEDLKGHEREIILGGLSATLMIWLAHLAVTRWRRRARKGSVQDA